MTTTPTAFAVSIADQLARVLQAIHVHYADQVGPAVSAATDHRHFGPARQLVADSEYIADEVERIVKSVSATPRLFSDALGTVVSELVRSGEVDGVLEDLDPERLANEDRLVAELRESGNWTDDEEADRQLDMAERAARYPQVSQ
jgi:hypothetical protein